MEDDGTNRLVGQISLERQTATANGQPQTVNREPLRTSVRELRQRRAYYRCCIPALAGFVSHRSIAPDGFSITRSDGSPEQRLL